MLSVPGEADGADGLTLGDVGSARDVHGAEMDERDRVAVARLDRERPSSARDEARERHDTSGRRAHRAARRPANIDTPVLPRRVRVRCREGERAQHSPVRWPDPGARRRRSGKQSTDGSEEQKTPHHAKPPVVFLGNKLGPER